MRLKNILVPIDFSTYSINALKLANEIARKAERTIFLLHAIEVPIDKYSFIKDRQKDLIKSIYISNFIDTVKKKFTEIRDENKSINFTLNESLRIGDPFNEIIKFVEEDNIEFPYQKNADLIAVGLHEKSGIRRLISGGLLIDEISDHAFRPILTYHFDIRKDKNLNRPGV